MTQKFEKKKIEIEINVPVGFSVREIRTSQTYLSDLKIIMNETGFNEITEVAQERIYTDLIFEKIKDKS